MIRAINRVCSIQVEHDGTKVNRHTEIEQSAAIAELLETSYFELVDRQSGPYRLTISTRAGRLTFHVADEQGKPIVSHILSTSPLRRVIRDYVTICEGHFEASSNGDARRIEAIDMGRRATHNEASEILRQRLESKVRTDLDTARRFFTIIAAPYLDKVYHL